MKCPACIDGMMLPAVPHEDFCGFPCDICGGTAIFPDNLEYDPERGRYMKEDRIKRKVLLREEAKKVGIPASKLSMMERGYFDK